MRELVALLSALDDQQDSVVMVLRSGLEEMLVAISDGDGLKVVVGDRLRPVVVLEHGR